MAGGTKRQQGIARALAALAPQIPLADALEVRRQALGAAGLRRLRSADRAVWLALVAYVRHRYTDYDALLDEGYDREAARHFVVGDIEAVLQRFGVRRGLEADLPDDPDGDDAAGTDGVAARDAGATADAADRPVKVRKAKRETGAGDHDPEGR